MAEDVSVTVKQRWPYLILLASGFGSEADAEQFLPRIQAALWNLALTYNISFKPCFRRSDISRPDDPYQGARNLAKAFGQTVTEPVEPLHGLTQEEGYAIFESSENIRVLAMGDGSVHVSTSWANASRALAEGIRTAHTIAKDADDDLTTAIDLYLASFYETSVRARFLTLMTCLEVLAPVTDKHGTVTKLLADFGASVETQLSSATNTEERDALEALLRELNFKKETSIRRRLRFLILTEAAVENDARENLARQVVAAYDLRGTIVHRGLVSDQELREANDTALATVKMLLRARLGLVDRPART
ncbi:hypothetical protein [Defluviimonas sp. SAOS-178_SWC]|uniref:hypothetical protein n=1 Tax=Defluviimonas sp. SAOS-178_SWC TaxID=3121287 RepID=UPI003221A4DB